MLAAVPDRFTAAIAEIGRDLVKHDFRRSPADHGGASSLFGSDVVRIGHEATEPGR